MSSSLTVILHADPCLTFIVDEKVCTSVHPDGVVDHFMSSVVYTVDPLVSTDWAISESEGGDDSSFIDAWSKCT